MQLMDSYSWKKLKIKIGVVDLGINWLRESKKLKYRIIQWHNNQNTGVGRVATKD